MNRLFLTAAMSALLGLGATGLAQAQMAFYGNYYYSDGSQHRQGVAGAAPNIIATANGVRCSYQYVVRNGQRIRYEVCD